MEEKIFTALKEKITAGSVLKDEPLSNYTSFRTGGPADCMVMPGTEAELAAVLKLARTNGIPFYIMGNGSNLLVSDEGYRGIIILLRRSNAELTFAEADGQMLVTAAAGCALTRLAVETARQGLAGLSFAAGIPGSVGGAVVMNAGAYGGEIRDCLISVRTMDCSGGIHERSAAELDLTYRHSNLPEREEIVLEAVFGLSRGDRNAILGEISELNGCRRDKQPLEYPSAGSTFKRPEGYYAGKLIEDAGLKGYTVGGACVSEKHCGFVINRDGATSADIMQVINDVQRRVFETFGVRLEPEVRFVGF